MEAFGRAVDRIKTLGVLLIITHRPEFEPPWIGQPHVAAIILNRLGERQIAAIIDSLTGNKPLSPSIRQDIIERTDGIPLFVEEMTKAVLEAESESDAQQTAAAVPSSVLAVPASLHASLMARLDRLGPAREVAQIGAAIGREFSHALLEAVAGKPEQQLASALDRLVAAGLIFRQGVSPQANYLFKHALVQDAAYGTLLREPRRALHARIAETLENQFAEIAQNQPALLARHFTQAGLIEKAALLWGKAGQQSLARSALVEATAQFNRALAQIAALPATPALRREQIKLQVALITPLMYLKGLAGSETKAAVERARLLIEQAETLGEPLDDPLLLFSVLYGFWFVNLAAFNGDVLRELATQFLALAEKRGDDTAHDWAPPHGYFIAVHRRFRGRPSALRSGARALRRRQAPPAGGSVRSGQPSGDLVVSIHRLVDAWLSRSCAGRRGSSAQRSPRDRPCPVVDVCAGYDFDNPYPPRKLRGSKHATDELVAVAEEKSAVFWKAVGRACKVVLAETGKPSDAVHQTTSGMTAYRSREQHKFAAFAIIFGESLCGLCQFDDAWRCIDEAMAAVEKIKERWCEAKVNRVAGEIALKMSEPSGKS